MEELELLTVEELQELAKGEMSTKDATETLSRAAQMTEDQLRSLDADGALTDFYAKLQKIPSFKNYNRRRELASGIENGLETIRTISNIATARKQIDLARTEGEALQEPAAPPTTPKSQELESATETARRDLQSPIRDIDPILQRNMDLLNTGLSNAKTAGTGQAGVTGAMQQAAINNATRANQALIPQIEGIRRQQQAEYNRLISAGIGEDDMRFKQSMRKYAVATEKYMQEARAIGQLGAQGNTNLYGQQADLFGDIGNLSTQMMGANFRGSGAPQAGAIQTGAQPINSVYDPAELVRGGYNEGAISRASNRYTAIGSLGDKYQTYGNKLLGDLQPQLPFYNHLGQR